MGAPGVLSAALDAGPGPACRAPPGIALAVLTAALHTQAGMHSSRGAGDQTPHAAARRSAGLEAWAHSFTTPALARLTLALLGRDPRLHPLLLIRTATRQAAHQLHLMRPATADRRRCSGPVLGEALGPEALPASP